MGAHRYWRYSCGSDGSSYLAIAEIRFNDASGTQPAGATAICISGYSPASSQDGDLSTSWFRNQQDGNPIWLGVDFGEGNAVDVQTFSVSSQQPGDTSMAPDKAGSIDWSDDGVNWTVNHYVPAQPNWQQGETRTLSATPGDMEVQANGLAFVAPSQLEPGSSIPSVDQIAVIGVVSVTPPHADAQVDQIAIVIAAYAPPYVAPPVVIKLPCLSYCLPLYYIKESNYVV